MSHDAKIDAEIADVVRSGRTLEESLDDLIRAHPNDTITILVVVMRAYGKNLLEARGIVETRQFELAWPEEIAVSRRWVAERVARIRASGRPVEEVVLDYLEGGSGTPWEPTGLTERAKVISEAYEMPYGDASTLIVETKHGRRG